MEHHDAIPCALIGALSPWESLVIPEPKIILGPITALLHSTYFSVRAHQYIPGVFPFSSLVVEEDIHHVEHHYGHMSPLLGWRGVPIEEDLDNYKGAVQE